MYSVTLLSCVEPVPNSFLSSAGGARIHGLVRIYSAGGPQNNPCNRGTSLCTVFSLLGQKSECSVLACLVASVHVGMLTPLLPEHPHISKCFIASGVADSRGNNRHKHCCCGKVNHDSRTSTKENAEKQCLSIIQLTFLHFSVDL